MKELLAIVVATAVAQPVPPHPGYTIFDPVSLYFEHGSAELNENYQDMARRFAELAARPELQEQKLLIMGHADSSGHSSYNMLLSCRRALAVRDRLLAEGVAPERLLVEGHGENRVIVDAGDDDNRRVAILFVGEPSLQEWRRRYGAGRPC